jgi:hypothetical protein
MVEEIYLIRQDFLDTSTEDVFAVAFIVLTRDKTFDIDHMCIDRILSSRILPKSQSIEADI